mmetsp:Transcript_8203/g.24138  ORF Transcript_8203/g.24138 Transcript_8203/m.24138 type:complete len:145 (+) Transcript_8203:57-491(+)
MTSEMRVALTGGTMASHELPSSFILDFLSSNAGGALGGAAGAGLGGKAMYEVCKNSCEPKTFECADSCANKAFIAAAVGAGAGSLAGTGVQKHVGGGAAPLDEWTAGPVAAVWNELQRAPPELPWCSGRQQQGSRRRAEHTDFL